MSYIIKAIKFTLKHPFLLLIYIICNLSIIPLHLQRDKDFAGIVEGVNIFLYNLIIFGLFFVYLFIISGVYSIIWHKFIDTNSKTRNVFYESKKYFGTLFIVILVISLSYTLINITQLSLMSFVFKLNMRDFYNTSKILNISVGQIPHILISVWFVYIYACIYVYNLKAKQTISRSWRFLTNNFIKSLPVILLIVVSFALQIYLISLRYEFNDLATKLSLIGVNYIIKYSFEFLIFLTSSQIFKEYYKFKNFRKT